MIDKVNTYLIDRYRIDKNAKLLLAVSGGIDSMVMLDMFQRLSYNIGVVHINHSTRNGASDEDQIFLQEYCNERSIPFYARKLTYELLKEGNFQDNARKARYRFFNEIIKDEAYDYVLTAHHADDQWETFLMNLNRGSGLQGLKGIIEKTNQIIRPFLATTKEEIADYQAMNQVPYVEDISNSEDRYTRNRIRHHVTPKINEIYPNFINKVSKSTRILRQELDLVNELVQHISPTLIEKGKKKIKIRLKKIKEFESSQVLLYYLLQPYGFDFKTVKSILKTKRTGAMFMSKNYEVLHDRKMLILRKRDQQPVKINFDIPAIGEYQLDKINIALNPKEKDSVVQKHLLLKSDQITFPLKIRNWQPGDKFKPSGMSGSKKIKKFLTDKKLSRFEKENILVLEQEGKIIQVVDLRTADGYLSEEEVGLLLTLTISEEALTSS